MTVLQSRSTKTSLLRKLAENPGVIGPCTVAGTSITSNSHLPLGVKLATSAIIIGVGAVAIYKAFKRELTYEPVIQGREVKIDQLSVHRANVRYP